jgi:hypothetical protein
MKPPIFESYPSTLLSGDRLVCFGVVLPWITAELAQPLMQIMDGPHDGSLDVVDFLFEYRDRYRQSFSSSDSVRIDGRRPLAVTQIVDKDLSYRLCGYASAEHLQRLWHGR